MERVRTVLFACVRNAGRSQLAAAFFQEMADASKARAVSAGSRPADAIHPEVLRVLERRGLRPQAAAPRQLTPELARQASLLVTMGCGEACPVVPGLETIDWSVPDPHGRPEQDVEAIAIRIERLVEALVRSRDWLRRR